MARPVASQPPGPQVHSRNSNRPSSLRSVFVFVACFVFVLFVLVQISQELAFQVTKLQESVEAHEADDAAAARRRR